ncbi:transposase, Ptta/En/Spm, transposase, Tnp1/En/Spm-like protein [Tanacetum coccineum]
MTIELADRTIMQPKGIATNVLVRIGKFVFPIDFVILDIPEDNDVPLILRRPFLSTAHVKIDVYKRKVTLRNVGGKNNETNNGGNIQEVQRCIEDLTHEPSACKIRRFEMTKHTFEADEEYVATKELEHINRSETNMDARYAYRELFRKMDDGWLVTRAMDE